MSRRNAEAGEPAAASRARRRLTASLGPAGSADGADGRGTGGAVSGPGLLGHGNGAAGGNSFRYDGGARPARDEDGSPSGGAAPGPSRFRWRTGVRVAMVVGVLGLLLGGWFWWDVAAGSPQVTPLGDVRSTEVSAQPDDATGAPEVVPGGPASGGQATGGTPGAKIVVHVAGAVRRAGVVELPQGSRVHDAIAAAGGGTAEADLNRLNLAAVLIDGQKIYVPAHGEVVDGPAGVPAAGSSAGEAASGGPAAGARIDLNSASVEELGALPRVGPVLAQRIVDWRKEHGRFSTVEELDAVDGVGPKMLETLLPLVRVS